MIKRYANWKYSLLESYRPFADKPYFKSQEDYEEHIETFCRTWGIDHYRIRKDGFVDAEYVSIHGCQLSELRFKFGKVEEFACRNSWFSTLCGFPEESSHYHIEGLGIQNLNYSPSRADTFSVIGCKRLASLEGAPRSVGKFICKDNKLLKSLKDGPEVVSESYDVRECDISSPEGFPEDFRGPVYMTGNPLNELVSLVPRDKASLFINLLSEYGAIQGGNVVEERLRDAFKGSGSEIQYFRNYKII